MTAAHRTWYSWAPISPAASGHKRSCPRRPGNARKPPATGRWSDARSRRDSNSPNSNSRPTTGSLAEALPSSLRAIAGDPRIDDGPHLHHVLAAVDRQRRTGDGAGLVGGEEYHGTRNLLGLAEATDRDQRQDRLLQHVLRHRLHHFGV